MHTHTDRPSPDPKSAVAWAQEDGQGNLWVYYKLKGEEYSAGEQLTGTGPDHRPAESYKEQLMRPRPAVRSSNCIWTGFCWICL